MWVVVFSCTAWLLCPPFHGRDYPMDTVHDPRYSTYGECQMTATLALALLDDWRFTARCERRD